MIGGGGVSSSSSLKNEAFQSAAAATSATTSNNNNVDDESSNVHLSAVDCGEWLLGRVLRALLLLLADKKNENNNNDGDGANYNDSDGEKKATNKVRSLLLATVRNRHDTTDTAVTTATNTRLLMRVSSARNNTRNCL